MPKPARPTLRLLPELAGFGDWEDSYERAAAAAASPLSQLPPLDQIAHPVIRHAATLYPGTGKVAAQRESISAIEEQVLWKLKTGRWRGAVHEDGSGQAWLVAVGLRAEGDAADFYSSFPDAVKSRGLAAFLPTDEDYKRLRLEKAEEQLTQWERDIHEVTRGAFAIAAETGAQHFAVAGLHPDDPSLCHVRIEVETISYDDEPDEQLNAVIVTVRRSDWTRADLADRADIVILAAIEPREQLWDVTSLADGAIFSFDCSPEELTACLQEDAVERVPGRTIAGQLRHWAHRGRLTQHVVEGKAIEGLCGVWFVPRQDADRFATCPHCEAIYRQLPQ